MRRGDVRSFVAPNCPSAQCQLNEKKCDPPHRQFPERGNLARVSPNARTKCNYTDRNQQRDKTMYHLQPNLESIHVRQTTRISPGVDLCQRCGACIRNPRTVSRGKIENRQVAMLMAHCRPQRKLHINRERDYGCNVSNRRNVGQ